MEGDEALEVLRGASDLHVTKGRKVVSFDLVGDRPPDGELLKLLLGRSGRLRAPVVRFGTVVLVGYDADVMTRVFGT